MALTFSIVDTWDDGKRIHVSGTVVATGNYTTGGDTVDLSQVPIIASAQPPIQGTAWMDGLAGYDYIFSPGAAMNSNKVKIFQQELRRERSRNWRRAHTPELLRRIRSPSTGSSRNCSRWRCSAPESKPEPPAERYRYQFKWLEPARRRRYTVPHCFHAHVN